MVTSGTPSPIRVSQKRLTIILFNLALLGTVALSLIWLDSLENTTAFSTRKRSIIIADSSATYTFESLMSFGMQGQFYRGKRVIDDYDESDPPLFPSPEVSSDFISIPTYLLIPTYLATLLLIWLTLMNRLARREHAKR